MSSTCFHTAPRTELGTPVEDTVVQYEDMIVWIQVLQLLENRYTHREMCFISEHSMK